MILIKDIKVSYVEGDVYEHLCYSVRPTGKCILYREGMYAEEIRTEMVLGRIFTNADKEEVCIGMTPCVQRAIGLPFEAFDTLQKELEEARNSYNNVCRVLNQQNKKLFTLLTMPWWQRLKFLFNKNIIEI